MSKGSNEQKTSTSTIGTQTTSTSNISAGRDIGLTGSDAVALAGVLALDSEAKTRAALGSADRLAAQLSAGNAGYGGGAVGYSLDGKTMLFVGILAGSLFILTRN